MTGPDGTTLVEGTTFCRSDPAGNITASRPEGLFVKDTRIISRWELTVDGQAPEPLTVMPKTPFRAVFVARAATRPGRIEPTLIVERERMVADGMREDLRLRNYGPEPAGVTVTLSADADFADLFTVKDGRAGRSAPSGVHTACGDSALELSVGRAGHTRGVRIGIQEGSVLSGMLVWQVIVPGHGGSWSTTVQVTPSDDDQPRAPRFPTDTPVPETAPADRQRSWERESPSIDCSDVQVQRTLSRSITDLGSLRITDPDRPDLDVVAAGAPWFMALFGRDSLITSWLALPWDRTLSRGTLHALARLQGRKEDPLSEEEPGRIPHEVRLGIDPQTALGGSSVYYGSIDATPLFVALLGHAARWGLPEDDIRTLLPAADSALDWVRDWGDKDGDGFVEYARKTDRGLANQGWKDSGDSIVFRDGTLATGPIALAEVQGYVYAAYRARAFLAGMLGDATAEQRWSRRADDLKAAFNDAFWLADHGYYALALDGDKRPVDGLASNQGHCLWSGIADEDKAARVADLLVSPAMFSGWGVRTLAAGMGAYNPASYHNGSVWPHDNALIVAGLAHYGRYEQARTIATGLFDAAAHFDGRLPELFCGFDRRQMPEPVPYPASCSPQAWASAAPLGVVGALLDLQPDPAVPAVTATPRLPEAWGALRVRGMAIGAGHVDLDTATVPAGTRTVLPPTPAR